MLKVFARAVFVACVSFATAANAAWPDRPVTLIVPYPAGGITDVLSRLTAELLQATFKQNVHRPERDRRRRHHRRG